MLFASYGAPEPSRGKNPLLIVLGVCGGCVVLVIIGVVVMGALAAKTFSGLGTGIVKMTQTMPQFLGDLQTHNYRAAENLVDPSAQDTLTAAKIQSMEEAVEKKLGPLQSYPAKFSSQAQNQIAGPGGQATKVEYVYTYPLTYQKGTATATFKFLLDASGAASGDLSKMKLSGKVTGFKLEPESQ